MSKRIEGDSTAKQLTKIEQAAILSGQDTWNTRAIPRLAIRSLFLADGPHGLRKQTGAGDHLGINASVPATCFPTSATVANSWDVALAHEIGTALGKEAAHIGVDVVLGPGLNIKRSPLGGRNFEYFSEDPILSGKMAAAYVSGIQAQGVAASPKHFAANSQETRRMASDSIVDAATLREIYLTAFEIVVREANPRVIMSSYNRINGTYAHENYELLQEILRDEWGFDGVVLTDWGGANDPVAAIAAGGTLQMPSPGFDSVQQILGSSEQRLEKLTIRAQEVIDLVRWIDPQPQEGDIFLEHHLLAERAAAESIVLLKNDDDILPLAPKTKVAVIGEFAHEPRYQGAGSSLVNPTQLVSPLDALADSELEVVGYSPGFEYGKAEDPELVAAAVDLAKQADVALVYLGLDNVSESEGKDRDHLDIGAAQVAVLEQVAAANPNVVVVLAAGAVIEMPWLVHIKGLLHGYLGGQAGAVAMVRTLTGENNPSGRLAESYPLRLEDTPTAGNFPEESRYACYTEGPYVGYRYYQSAGIPVLFPFGFGLSYTNFKFSNLTVDEKGVAFSVSNTGTRAGATVAQLYVEFPDVARKLGPRPKRELKAFQKVSLAPQERKEIRIEFDHYTFRAFDSQAHAWVKPAGNYQIIIGENVAEPLLQDSLQVAGDEITSVAPVSDVEAYANAKISELTPADFAVLIGKDIPSDDPRAVPLNENSPLRDLEYARSWVGRFIYRKYFQRGLRRMEEKGIPDLNLLFQYGMPFRSIANMSGGLADARMVEAILTMMNGRFIVGLFQVIGRFFGNRRRQRKLQREFTAAASKTN